jgi:hypothetical protein
VRIGFNGIPIVHISLHSVCYCCPEYKVGDALLQVPLN